MLDKFAVARSLREIARLLEFRGENPFKVRAWDMAAQAIEGLADDLTTLVAEDRLTEVRGIGASIAARVGELARTGRTDLLERLRSESPPGVLELVRVPELGPKKIHALHAALGIAGREDLKKACEAGLVRGVKGFGEKTERKILEAIRRYEGREKRWVLSDALEIGSRVLGHLRGSPAVERAELAGSVRRGKETVADLDVVAASRDSAAVMERFLAFPLVEETIGRGGTKCSVRLGGGLQIDLRVLPPEDFATGLHHFTGSKEHHVRLRGIARDRGLTISEWGVTRLAGGEKLRVETEADLYRLLGLPPMPPEIREDRGEIESGLAGELPDDWIEPGDLRGAVHCHTTHSDGKGTVEEMARAAEELGFEYLTITDHSPAAHYAGGLDVERLRRQWDEIDRVQERVSVRLLRGTEADILADGALDYPDDVLERLDVVVASIHSRMKMDAEAMTRRLVAAMRHPLFKIWGHPLGRLLESRPPFECRVEEVLDAVAESRAAVEINGDPRRLDLEPRWIREARKRGIRFVISADAHSPRSLANVRFGVTMARRGWVRRGEVLNALSAEAFAAAVRPGG